jgi:SpoU rRNA methylase family enzyme
MRYYLCDTTSIALGKIFQISIFSGVKDLKYIAEKLNVKIMVIPEFFFLKAYFL